MADGCKATLFKYEMADFVRSCVKKYLEHAPGARLRTVDTPFLPEDQRHSPQGAPAVDGPLHECPWCQRTFPTKDNTYASEAELEKKG